MSIFSGFVGGAEACEPPAKPSRTNSTWQQGVDFLAAAEMVFRTGPREIVDAACLSAVFAVRLLMRAALGEKRDPGGSNLSMPDLFGWLDLESRRRSPPVWKPGTSKDSHAASPSQARFLPAPSVRA